MRVRVKFAKKESVKYLGHLDIMRFFQRCFNRADVRMEYSAGFNPHQKMSFAQPLGVGITSKGEYLDAEVADGQDPSRIREKLNQVCGEGFEILSVFEVKENAEKAMAALMFAAYTVDVRELGAEEKVLSEAVERIHQAKEIPVLKRTKSKERTVDIRPQILRLSEKEGILSMLVTAASSNNLKAETLACEVFSGTAVEYEREKIKINRDELYAKDLIPLEKYQTVSE